MNKELEFKRENELLRKNVRDLQNQLGNAHIRIKDLTGEVQMLRQRVSPEATFHHKLPSGWAMPPVENPDAPHLKKDKNKDE